MKTAGSTGGFYFFRKRWGFYSCFPVPGKFPLSATRR